jgi:hypothetical protein
MKAQMIEKYPIPDIISQFKVLKLHGMAECYAEMQAQGQTSAAEQPVAQPVTGLKSHGSKYTGYTLPVEFP